MNPINQFLFSAFYIFLTLNFTLSLPFFNSTLIDTPHPGKRFRQEPDVYCDWKESFWRARRSRAQF